MADFELKKNVGKEWYWTFQADNNLTIAKSSESYKNRQDCIHSINLVKAHAPTALVFDMTGEKPAIVPSRN